MTFDEAFAILNSKPIYFYKDKAKWKNVIVPLNKLYFEPYNTMLYLEPQNNESLIEFTKDNEFTIWIYRADLLAGEYFKL